MVSAIKEFIVLLERLLKIVKHKRRNMWLKPYVALKATNIYCLARHRKFVILWWP